MTPSALFSLALLLKSCKLLFFRGQEVLQNGTFLRVDFSPEQLLEMYDIRLGDFLQALESSH